MGFRAADCPGVVGASYYASPRFTRHIYHMRFCRQEARDLGQCLINWFKALPHAALLHHQDEISGGVLEAGDVSLAKIKYA
jgi:hypothetical protein